MASGITVNEPPDVTGYNPGTANPGSDEIWTPSGFTNTINKGQSQGGGGYSPLKTQLPGGYGGGGSGISAQQQLQDQLSWSLPIFEHYLGRDPSYRELLEIQRRGFNPERLQQHIRAQGSYIPGLTIGQLEDYHTNSKQTFGDWLGRDATDEDIRDLHNRGLMDPQQIDEYIRNRPDVVALHPGAPLNMKDLEYHTAKNTIDSSYLQNLGRTSSDEEARTGIQDRSKGPKPVQDQELQQQYGESGSGGLESKQIIAPNARAL